MLRTEKNVNKLNFASENCWSYHELKYVFYFFMLYALEEECLVDEIKDRYPECTWKDKQGQYSSHESAIREVGLHVEELNLNKCLLTYNI